LSTCKVALRKISIGSPEGDTLVEGEYNIVYSLIVKMKKLPIQQNVNKNNKQNKDQKD
jgi:hypothetical protein